MNIRKVLLCSAIFMSCNAQAAYLEVSPLYDSYVGNSGARECWNTFLIDTIGNTNQSASEMDRLSILVSVDKKKPVEMELQRIDYRFLIGTVANPSCSDAFQVVKVIAMSADGAPISIDLSVSPKNTFLTKSIRLTKTK